MAVTGPIQAPVTFNAVYELDDLLKFLAKTQTDLDSRFELINAMIGNIEVNECGLIKFENVRRMLEDTVAQCEDLTISMSTFTHGLIEKKLIRRNTSLPQMNKMDLSGMQKRDSGIAFETASSSSETLQEETPNQPSTTSENEQLGAKSRKQVSFDLLTPNTSSAALNDETEMYEKSLPSTQPGTGKVFVHLIPSGPGIDLSALKAEVNTFSTSVLNFHNIEVQLVTSDIVIGLSTRHISTSSDRHKSSSSEGQSSGRGRFKSANEIACNNLSRFALEHSETSDEDNTRLLSSSDSDASIIRFKLKPVIEMKSVEVQTED